MSGAKRNKKEMRRNLCAPIGYVEANEWVYVYSSKGTYLNKGEQFSYGIDVYQVESRDKYEFEWRFTCRPVRKLTKTEFVEKRWPKPVHGKPWKGAVKAKRKKPAKKPKERKP